MVRYFSTAAGDQHALHILLVLLCAIAAAFAFLACPWAVAWELLRHAQ
jgi:hypothetical protein